MNSVTVIFLKVKWGFINTELRNSKPGCHYKVVTFSYETMINELD